MPEKNNTNHHILAQETNTCRVESIRPDYRNLALLELSALIVRRGDRGALDALHEHRTVFRGRAGKPLRLVEYLDELRQQKIQEGVSESVADDAYALTLQRFYEIPDSTGVQGRSQEKKRCMLKHVRVDARSYLKAYLTLARSRIQARPELSSLKREMLAARLLQYQVKRHFGFCLLEALRNGNGYDSRYAWVVTGEKIYVYFPRTISGRARRAWLEANIEDPDPRRPGEAARIQAIIDREWPKFHTMPYDLNNPEIARHAAQNQAPSSPTLDVFPTARLAEIVAREKVANIDRQRPAIRALGDRLYALILRLFNQLGDGQHSLARMGREFGLSKATLSRFAGTHWIDANSDRAAFRVPDLWRNMLGQLMACPEFAQAAQDAGIWCAIQAISARMLRDSERGDGHDR